MYIGIHIFLIAAVPPWQQFDKRKKKKEKKKQKREEGTYNRKSKKKGNNVRLVKKCRSVLGTSLEVEVFSEERSDAMMLRGMKRHRILDN